MSIAKAGETDRLGLSCAEGFHCSGSFQAECKQKPNTEQSLKFSAVSSTISPGPMREQGRKSDFGNGRASRPPRCGARGPTARAVGKNGPSQKAPPRPIELRPKRISFHRFAALFAHTATHG